MRDPQTVQFSGQSELPEYISQLETPFQYFKFLFPGSLISLIADQSNLYALQNDVSQPLCTTAEEIEMFIGTCMWMSITQMRNSRWYWSAETRISQVADNFPVGRFEKLKHNIHFIDNSTLGPKDAPGRDRLAKVRPLIDTVNEQLSLVPLEEHLSIDEQIIPFKGRSSLRQYCPKKPKKWGYKVFVLSGVSGFSYKLEVYTGQENTAQRLSGEPDCGASGNVVVRLSRMIPRGVHHKVYFDNYFNCPTLQVYLEKDSVHCIGTVRTNRVPGVSLPSEQEMKKKGRGHFEERVAVIDGIELSCTRWQDTRAVTLLSSFVGTQPATSVSRYDRQKKERSEIPCPAAITIYNKHMGGVDLLNSLISIYRPYLRLKRYYFRVFLHILDLTTVNAWLLYKRNVMKKRDQYTERLLPLAEFKMDLAASLCKAGKTALKKRGRPSNESVEQASDEKKKRGPSAPTPTQDVRLDQVGHWVLWSKKRQRCKLPGCTGICMSYCVKCGIHLCSTNKSNCFFVYHTTK
nr:piggyBac transposable element-derived protein 3-like [Dermacentor andersoni]